MLKTRNLDDQTYAEIVESARGRLPWLCPVWTDHNSTDPGITILELMAWYKELQQYQMNQVTGLLKLKLLKLAGAYPRPAAPARCAVEIAPGEPPRLAGERLYTREGVPFELAEAVPERRPALARVCVRGGGREMEVGGILGDRPITFQPFELDGGSAVLAIGFSRLGEGPLRLWFDVEEPAGVERNPFADDHQVPRLIRWTCDGAAATEVLKDDTHALSVSGCVTLAARGGWPAGPDGLHWLILELTDPGCEESVRLSGISADRYTAVQQETWARMYTFPGDGAAWSAVLEDARANTARLSVFLRTPEGWEQTDLWHAERTPEGLRLDLDTSGGARDGEDNVMVLALDPIRAPELLFDARGLPGETFFLRLEGLTALTGHFTLLCSTLCRDGKVRPALWRCVDDLYQYGPRDRVFVYDPDRETVTFGDGEHGALLQGGEGAVLAAELVVSCCAGGNIPGGRNLAFAGCAPLLNTAAAGGVGRETADDVQARLLRALSETDKCVSAADYERLARRTPGLRVAAARAIPAYDPGEPTGVSRAPTVTVVVVPDSPGGKPMPDARFLETVERHLERRRPIGTSVKVVPPVYVTIDVTVSLRGGDGGTEAALAEDLTGYFARLGIGGTVRAGDVAALVQAAPGVLQVRRAVARTNHPGCRQNADGDIRLPRLGIARLGRLAVERLSVERAGR